MGTAQKTITYAFPMRADDLTDSADEDFTQITVYIPETTRTFRSVLLEVGWQDIITATGGTIGQHAVGLSVAGSAYTTVTEADDITHSGENIAVTPVQYDFTALFAASFGAGASATVDCRLNIVQSTGTTLGARNATALLHITYDYDDTSATQALTAWIPLESPTARLNTGSLTELGTDQVPQLTGAGGFLKENSPTIRDYFFLIEGNESANGGTTDLQLDVALDEDDATSWTFERTLASERYDRLIWRQTGAIPDTTAAHAFMAMCAQNAWAHLSITLVVTYEFTLAGTTAATNSLRIPFYLGGPGATATADANVVRVTVDVQEPATIALLQSGVQLYMTPGGVASDNALTVKVGGQSERSYSPRISNGHGSAVLTQRLDSGSAAGAGVTLNARGRVNIDIAAYCGAQYSYQGICGVLYLNYSSGIAAGGRTAHARTVVSQLCDYDAAIPTQYREIAAVAPVLPETAYAVVAHGLVLRHVNNGAANMVGQTFCAELLSGEGPGAAGNGWLACGRHDHNVFSETGWFPSMHDLTPFFQRHPADPDTTRLALETARKWRFMGTRCNGMAHFLTTYHTMTFSATGAVTGYAGTGAVTVKVHEDANAAHLYTVTASAGGSYTATIYDSTRDHYSQVYEDATHVGRSAPWKAT